MIYRRLFIPNTAIFLTIVTNNRDHILLKNIDLIKDSFFNTIKFYKFFLIAYTIQSNHIHCVIKPKNISEYPNIVKSFKYSFTKKYKQQNPNCLKVWQNRFWEHTIRDENDMNIHLDYIHYNSTKHNNIAPKNWQYSSFKKFVKLGYYDENWCNLEDINHIKNLNFE